MVYNISTKDGGRDMTKQQWYEQMIAEYEAYDQWARYEIIGL